MCSYVCARTTLLLRGGPWHRRAGGAVSLQVHPFPAGEGSRFVPAVVMPRARPIRTDPRYPVQGGHDPRWGGQAGGWSRPTCGQRVLPATSLTQAADLSCIVLFGACIEGVILRDKYVSFMASGSFWASTGFLGDQH